MCKYIYPCILISLLFSCSNNQTISITDNASEIISDSILWKGERITGVSLEMPPQKIDSSKIVGIKTAGAEWVSMIPYGYTPSGAAEVRYDHGGQWWGESVDGVSECIRMSKAAGFKVMMKPHVWVIDDGWPGKFDAGSEERWKIWEASYRKYILEFAQVAEDEGVELFCVGTEYRIAVVKRVDFWRELIQEVREIYSGELTYAANWDNYERITFWDELDFIGIDAYFRLSQEKEPTLKELKQKWNEIGIALGAYSSKENKQVVFTEYGTRSLEYANSGKYGDNDSAKPNMRNQTVAYQALFESIWQEDWMAGGFFWKWHLQNRGGEIGGVNNDDYTPQGKPSLEMIRTWYVRSSSE